MSDNGTNGPSSRILPLNGRRPLGKGGDFITHDQCAAMIVGEASKIHNFYLTQIPQFTAKMIQDALVAYGILKVEPPADIAPPDASNEPEIALELPETRESIASSPETADTTGAMLPPAGVPCE